MNGLRKKLNLKQQSLILLRIPSDVEKLFSDEQPWTKYDEMPSGTADAVLAFAKDKESLNQLIPEVMENVDAKSIVWFAYPKKSSKKYQSDVTRDTGWEALAPYAYRPVRQIAIDEDWSALRFRPEELVG